MESIGVGTQIIKTLQSIVSIRLLVKNIDSRYFPYIFPIILHQITEDTLKIKKYNVNYSDIEKVVQIYLKWIFFRKTNNDKQSSTNNKSNNFIKITPKHKKIWKKNLNF